MGRGAPKVPTEGPDGPGCGGGDLGPSYRTCGWESPEPDVASGRRRRSGVHGGISARIDTAISEKRNLGTAGGCGGLTAGTGFHPR